MRLIDADELLEYVWRCDVSTREKIAHIVKQTPTVEPKKGKWKEVQVPFGKDFTTKEYECEICGYQQYHHENFCGRCGARMEKEET